MSTYSIYDYDYFTYEHVIPNLECAKLIAYLRNHRHIAVLSPSLNPSMYTKCIIRKEYDDGIFPRQMFLQNCEYGGRAFNPGQYKPFIPEVEETIPDMHIYDDYLTSFGHKKDEVQQISRILNCAHMRLAPDSHNILPIEVFQKQFDKKTTGIFLHDYDLASLDAFDLLLELQSARKYLLRDEIRPYPIGNKFPIRVYSSEELEKWFKIVTIPNCFFIEYYGLMNDETVYELCEQNTRMGRQLYYNISYGCSSENQFLIERAPKIYAQTLFLKKRGVKTLLTYDEGIFVTPVIRNFIQLLNYMLGFEWKEGFVPKSQTLYQLCRYHSNLFWKSWAFYTIKLTTEQNREIFQYVREHNYELFKMFYEWDSVIFKGGKFVNEWTDRQRNF